LIPLPPQDRERTSLSLRTLNHFSVIERPFRQRYSQSAIAIQSGYLFFHAGKSAQRIEATFVREPTSVAQIE
jgi:hypothetical protein